MLTTKSITEAQIETLKSEAGQAGDFRQVGLCVLALDGKIDFDDYTVFDAADRRWLQREHDNYVDHVRNREHTP